MRRVPRRYVRQMPKIYGNLQPQRRSYAALVTLLKAAAWAGGIAGTVYLLFYSQVFTVKDVEVQGAVLTSAERYRSLIPLGTNMWRLSKDSVTNEIFKDSLVVSAGIFRGLPSSVRIVIEEKKPALIWQSGDTLTLLDSDGYGFTQFTSTTFPTPDTTAGGELQNILRVVDSKNLPVETGKRVASAGFVQFITKTRDQFGELLPGVPIDHVEIAETTYDVVVVTKPGLRVLMSSLGSAEVQVRNLTRLILQGKASVTSTVDLRIDRWAYVQ